MKKYLILVVLLALPLSANAASQSKMKMDHFEASLDNTYSLQNGAKLFVNYCLSCHSAEFMRYNRLAEDLGIPPDLVEQNLMFTSDKIGNPMSATMSAEDGEAWFGVAPPDLSLIARLRGGEWLYNYLRAFYLDENSVSGWNNVVFENVAMPHVLYELQGQQKALFRTVTDDHGHESQVLDHFEIVAPGKLSEDEYAAAMRDLTNFMVYMGEPAKLVRTGYGIWVVMFLLFFALVAYMLKKEYWRDVH